MLPRFQAGLIAATGALVWAFVAADVQARTWTVDVDGGADFTSIQDAIRAASDGDAIEVAPGRYLEALDYCGRDVHVFSSGGIGGTVITPPAGMPAVTFAHGEGPGARLSGFTITGADTSMLTEEPPGAGVQITHACPTLTDLVIEGNRAYFGGGIKIKHDSHPLLQRVVVRDNEAVSCGGGIYMCQSSPTLIDVEVRENLAATMNGGGLIIGKGSFPHLHRVVIEGNVAAIDGGGIYALGVGEEGEPVNALLSHVTLSRNVCNIKGGEGHGANVYMQLATRMTLVNSVVHGGLGGEGIYSLQWNPANPPLSVTYSAWWGNAGGHAVAADHGELSDVVADTGNLEADPLFTDAAGGEYSLAEGSPCIDAGDPDTAWNDPDGSRADMGAYGGPWEVEHDTSDCVEWDAADPCGAGDDDDSADVVYKKCVCQVGGSPVVPVIPFMLGGLLVLRRRPRASNALGGAESTV